MPSALSHQIITVLHSVIHSLPHAGHLTGALCFPLIPIICLFINGDHLFAYQLHSDHSIIISNLSYRLFHGCISKSSSVQSLSCVQLFAIPWTAACQASLSTANSQTLLKLMSIESVMSSNHLILCRPLLLLPSVFPSIRVFSKESLLHIGGQNIGISASASVLPMNIQD